MILEMNIIYKTFFEEKGEHVWGGSGGVGRWGVLSQLKINFLLELYTGWTDLCDGKKVSHSFVQLTKQTIFWKKNIVKNYF